MQNDSNFQYSGLEELINTENYMHNYNNYIVELCLKQVKKINTCLDFGSGIGTLSKILKDKYKISPICIEIDEENRKYLNRRGFINYKDINESNGSFDLIFSSNVLEHINDDIEILKSINSRLNSEGYLFLFLPANMFLWTNLDETVGHYRRYSRSEIKQKLESAGFEVQLTCYADSIGFFASLIMKFVGYNPQSGIGSPTSLKLYDNYILRFSKFFDSIGLKFLFGKNIVAIATKID